MLPAAAQYQFSIFVSMRSKAAIAAIEISEAIHAYSRTVAPLFPAKVQPHPSHDAPFIRRTVVAAGNAKIVNWIDTTCLRQLQVNIRVLNCWSRSLLCFSQVTGLFTAAAAVY